MGFDIAFLIVVTVGAMRGFRRGFARQMLTIAGLVLGCFLAQPVATAIYPLVAESTLEAIPPSVRYPLLFLGTILVVWIGTIVGGAVYLSWYRLRAFGADYPSLGDRLFGAALGFAKATLVVCLACFFFERLPAAVREYEPIKKQYATSLAAQLASQQQVIDRIAASPEVQQLKEQCAQLLKHYLATRKALEEKAAVSQPT